jgi:threonine/homoserine/homoserine lactone efflux protein
MVLTFVGAAYLFWLGASILTSSTGDEPDRSAPARSALQIALRGAATSGLNPKGLLLYVALLPQFVRAGAGWPIPLQTGVLGGLHMADCAAGYIAVGVFARAVLATRPRLAAGVGRAAGVAMITLAGLLILERLVR